MSATEGSPAGRAARVLITTPWGFRPQEIAGMPWQDVEAEPPGVVVHAIGRAPVAECPGLTARLQRIHRLLTRISTCEVVPGAKVLTRSGKYDAVDIGAVIRFEHRCVHLGQQRARQGIALLGAIQRNGGNTLVDLKQNVLGVL